MYSIEEPVTVTGGPMQRITAGSCKHSNLCRIIIFDVQELKGCRLLKQTIGNGKVERGREVRRQETADRFHCVWNSHNSTPDKREGGGGGVTRQQKLAKLTNLYIPSLIHVKNHRGFFTDQLCIFINTPCLPHEILLPTAES